MKENVWERRDCVSAEVEGSLVLLDLETLVYHSLNVTAAAVWEALESPQPASALVDSLCERFEVEPEHCRASVATLLDTLTANQLIKSQAAIGKSA